MTSRYLSEEIVRTLADQMKKISIKDLAKRAGVAPSTVSGVINGKARERRISDKVAEQIEILAKKVGYQPNPTAVTLRTGKSKIIGLIIEDISNLFFATLARKIEDKAHSLGYKIVYCSTENNSEKGNELIKMLLHQQVDGFLITPSKGMEQQIMKLMKSRKPVVLMDRFFPEIKAPSVLVHNYAGVSAGMDHLIKKGYKTIAFVTVQLDQIQMHDRARGYRDALKSAGLPQPGRLILKLPYDETHELFVEKISAFITKNKDIDAIFFATNYLGIYGLESIQHLNLSIPNDIAVVCFDDHDIFRIVKPGITVIEQPIEDMAVTSIEILLSCIKGEKVNEKDRVTIKDARLLIRGSTR
jgi:LacI family transcriptional regulator